MKNSKILIFEDETLAGTMIADYCDELGYQVLGLYTSGEDFEERVSKHLPDILLMDINLDGTNGLKLYQQIVSKSIPVIFTTAYSDTETIDKAMSLNPVGYLVKPITKGQLKAQLIQAEHHKPQQPISINNNGIPKHIFPSEIIYLEAAKNYMHFVHDSGEITKVRETLAGVLDEIKDERFVRVHRSYIININHLVEIKRENCFLKNGIKVPIGRSYKNQLISRFNSK